VTAAPTEAAAAHPATASAAAPATPALPPPAIAVASLGGPLRNRRGTPSSSEDGSAADGAASSAIANGV
jgi:hypothetical protein